MAHKTKKREKDDFEHLLENTSISEIDKTSIRFISSYFQGGYPAKLASRSFVFEGPPGIGKTFLAEKLLQNLDVEVLYCAQATFDMPQATKCNSLLQLAEEAGNPEQQILFIDDLHYILNEDRLLDTTTDRQDFMAVLELIKRNPNKILIVTCNGFYNLDDTMIDRIEVKIRFDLPGEENKRTFLREQYKDYISPQQIELLAKNTIGYNFRDLPELLKLSYRLGKNAISDDCLKKALKSYKPTQMFDYEVQNGIELGLKDVIGNNLNKTALSRMVSLYQHQQRADRLGLRRSNLMLFHGPPGTGKSYTARCLAGELGYALISIRASNIYNRVGPYSSMNKIFDLAKRYKNCVIFIDEAEKLFGNERFGDDSSLVGEFNRNIDCSDFRDIKSILVLAANDTTRFGNAFHDRFVHLRFGVPTFDDRLEFCKRKAQVAKQHFQVQIDTQEVARITEAASYRSLERFWNELFFWLIENKEVNHDAISAIAKMQKQDEWENSIVG